MSTESQALVWKRSRVGKTDLLALVKIVDLADDEGRNAFIEVPALARALRSSERGALYVLHRLQKRGEIEIDLNTDGRYIILRGGRRFYPKWFLHVRCVCAWDAYQLETAAGEWAGDDADESEKIADSEPVAFPRGRPSRAPKQSEKIADFGIMRNPQSFPRNPKPVSDKSEKTRTPLYVRDPLVDPLVDSSSGTAAAAAGPKGGNQEAAAGAAAEEIRLAWNAAIEPPLVPVDELTPDRIALITAALQDRPFEAWAVIFERVAQSSFCCGAGPRGWVADLWWLLRKPEPSIQVLEGKYDDHFSDVELRTASDALFKATGGRCPHARVCETTQQCVRRQALASRARNAS